MSAHNVAAGTTVLTDTMLSWIYIQIMVARKYSIVQYTVLYAYSCFYLKSCQVSYTGACACTTAVSTYSSVVVSPARGTQLTAAATVGIPAGPQLLRPLMLCIRTVVCGGTYVLNTVSADDAHRLTYKTPVLVQVYCCCCRQ